MKTVDDAFPYTESLSKDELLETVGKSVLIVPGRGDLLYCVHETSSPQDKSIFRYTRNQRAVETKSRRFQKLRNILKPKHVQALENSLSKTPASTVNIEKYCNYLQTKAKVSKVLSSYYCSEGLLPINYNDSQEEILVETDSSNPTSGGKNDGAALVLEAKKELKNAIQHLQYVLKEKKVKDKITNAEVQRSETAIKEAEKLLKIVSTAAEEYKLQFKNVKEELEQIKMKLPPLTFRKNEAFWSNQ